MSIPSPNQLFHPNILNHDIYPDIHDFAKDVSEAYRQTILKFYELGCRYLQIDDVYWAGLAATKQLIKNRERTEDEKAEAIKLAAKVVNDSLRDLPNDLLITTHICRGIINLHGQLVVDMSQLQKSYSQKNYKVSS